MADNKDFTDCKKRLFMAQDAEKDNREMVKAADLFLNKVDGQWEPEILAAWDERPRYTFDQCNPVIDAIMGEMDSMDFAINVLPAGGDASKDIAEIYAGIIRNLENQSGARYIYGDAGRAMVGTGLSGWRVVQDYRDTTSFQQDLLIRPVNDFKERVWFDCNAVKKTMEDAEEAWVLTPMTRDKFDKLYPKATGVSVSRGVENEAYDHKPEGQILVGEWLYKKKFKKEIALMSNNQVFEVDDKFKQTVDEMQQAGVTVVYTRNIDSYTVYQQYFDGNEWLDDPTETVFSFIPIVPVYGNFSISEGKIIYWGAVEKLKDPQRVLNYAESKKIAQTALNPLPKFWMTKEQAASPEVQMQLKTINTNNDPVQYYDHVPDQPPPFKPPAEQPDTVLIETAASAEKYINRASGLFDANRGEGLSGQSGRTVELLQNKGDSKNFKYFKAMELAISHTCKIIVDALPRVYDTRQEMQVMAQDGTLDTVTIREKIFDQQSGEVIELNDISKGKYDIVCTSGPAYQNRQQETVKTILDIAAIDPTVMQLGSDILLNNIPSPGIEKIAERKRKMMVDQGLIPEDQLTDEEKEQVLANQEAQKNQPPDPLTQAQLGIAQAELEKAQANTQNILSQIDERNKKLALEFQKLLLQKNEAAVKAQAESEERIVSILSSQADQLKTQAETLNLLKTAIGADAIIGPGNIGSYENQVKIVQGAQRKQ